MKLLGYDIPSIDDWLSNLDEKQQAQAELIIGLVPFLVGYFMFLYNWIILWMDIQDAAPIPAVVMSGGYIVYYRWRDRVRAEAATLDAVSMFVRWNEAIAGTYNNVIAGFQSLSEKELTEPKALEDPALDPLRATIKELQEKDTYKALDIKGDHSIHDDVMIGHYYAKFLFTTPIQHPLIESLKTRTVLFIMDFPKDKTFRKIPGQYFSHKGQLFAVPAAVVDCVFLGWKEEIETMLIFRVIADQERARLMQIGVGLQPASSDLDDLMRATKIESARTAIQFIIEKNNAEDLVRVLQDAMPGVEEASYRGAARLLTDLDGLREKLKARKVQDWLTLKNILIAVLIIGGAYWAYNYFIAEPEPILSVTTELIRTLRTVI